MNATFRRAAVALLAFGFLTIPVRAASLRPEGPLRGYLPAGKEVAGWTKDGEPQEYEGGDLYNYIDGGAEIYEEYGFLRVIVQDYQSAGGQSVSLEIFEMKTAAAAFGIYTFKRSGKGERLELGGGGEVESYYLNFWKGRLLVTLTGFDESATTQKGLAAIARAVDSRIRDSAPLPGLVASLPPQGLDAGSVKYLKGLLGLNNTYAFYSARGLGFSEAVRGVYENDLTLLVLDYGTAESRAKGWLELKAYLAESDRFARVVTGDADVFIVRDAKGLFVGIGESGPRLLAAVGAERAAVLALLGRAR